MSLLIADHPPSREGIKLSVQGLASTCTDAGTVSEAVATAQGEQPDVAIVGSEIGGGALAAVEGIRKVSRRTLVIVVKSTANADDLLALLKAGASGCLPSNIDPAGSGDRRAPVATSG